MDDERIIDQYWQRNEQAITETDKKYGALCSSIAYGILSSREDTEECVSDTYMATWNSLPPQRPRLLRAYLGRITRNISLNRLRNGSARKRGGGELDLIYEELENCIAAESSPEKCLEEKELIRAVEAFLAGLPREERLMFLYRYWLAQPVTKIAARMGCKPGRVNSALYRSRQKLRDHLEKEGLL